MQSYSKGCGRQTGRRRCTWCKTARRSRKWWRKRKRRRRSEGDGVAKSILNIMDCQILNGIGDIGWRLTNRCLQFSFHSPRLVAKIHRHRIKQGLCSSRSLDLLEPWNLGGTLEKAHDGLTPGNGWDEPPPAASHGSLHDGAEGCHREAGSGRLLGRGGLSRPPNSPIPTGVVSRRHQVTPTFRLDCGEPMTTHGTSVFPLNESWVTFDQRRMHPKQKVC